MANEVRYEWSECPAPIFGCDLKSGEARERYVSEADGHYLPMWCYHGRLMFPEKMTEDGAVSAVVYASLYSEQLLWRDEVLECACGAPGDIEGYFGYCVETGRIIGRYEWNRWSITPEYGRGAWNSEGHRYVAELRSRRMAGQVLLAANGGGSRVVRGYG